MIGNNSCGVHSVMAGKTDDNVIELDVLLYDGTRLRVGRTSDEDFERIVRAGGRRGEIYTRLCDFRDRSAEQIRKEFPEIPRCVSGYNLPWLLPEKGFDVAKSLVGSESTLVLVLEATVRLVWSPPARSLLGLGYPAVYSPGDHILGGTEANPGGPEGMEDSRVHDMGAMTFIPRRFNCCRRARAGYWSSSAPRRRKRPTRKPTSSWTG